MKLFKDVEYKTVQKVTISVEDWSDILYIVRQLAHPHEPGKVIGATLKIIMEGHGEIELPLSIAPGKEDGI